MREVFFVRQGRLHFVFPEQKRDIFRKVKEIKELCGGVRVVRRTNKFRGLTQRLLKIGVSDRKKLPAPREKVINRISCQPARTHGQNDGRRTGYNITTGPDTFF